MKYLKVFYFFLLFLLTIFYLDEIFVNNYANFLQSFDKIKLIQSDLMHRFFTNYLNFIIDNNINFLMVLVFTMFIQIIYAYVIVLFFGLHQHYQGIQMRLIIWQNYRMFNDILNTYDYEQQIFCLIILLLFFSISNQVH